MMSSREDRFDGVIVTSSRSAEAWTAAMSSNSFDIKSYLEKWKGTSFYVVGSKTATSLEESLSMDFRPEGIRIEGATGSGNAEKLAEYIIRSVDGTKRRLLYLTGDKNRDTLPSKINEGSSNIELVPLQVYKTCEDSLLRPEIQEYAEKMRSDPAPEPTGVPNIWVVFFAPSSSSYALPHLKKEFQFRFTKPGQEEPEDASKPRAIPIAIGPTTATFLREEVGLHLEIVCKSPDPASLVQAIESYRLER